MVMAKSELIKSAVLFEEEVLGLGLPVCRERLKRFEKKETQMPQNRMFDELSSKISALLAQSPAKDAEKNVRALLASFFSRLDLLTREEFDVQAKLLARSREQINALEARVAELETRVSKPNA